MSKIDEARAAGYSEQEIQQYLAPKIQEAQDSGYSQDEINSYLGVKPLDHAAANGELAKRVSAGTEDGSVLKLVGETALQVGKGRVGDIESVLNVGTGALIGFPGYLIGGLAGVVKHYTNSPETDPKQIAQKVSSILTYEPRTDEGKNFATTLTYPLQKLTDISEAAGKGVAEKTGSPGLAALTEASIQTLPMVLLGSLGKAAFGKVPTPSDVYLSGKDIATLQEHAQPKPTAMPQVKVMADAVHRAYERTGVHPAELRDLAITDPTVRADLASSNMSAPRMLGGSGLVYHGTARDFTQIMPSSDGLAGPGIYFAVDPREAANAARGRHWITQTPIADGRPVDSPNAKVFVARLNLKKPATSADLDAAQAKLGENATNADVQRLLKQEGFDGYQTHDMAVAWDPSQVHVIQTVSASDAAAGKFTSQAAPGDAQAAVLSRINFGKGSGPGLTLNQVYAHFKDDLYPIRAVEEKLTKGATLDAAESPYILARLTRGAAGKATQFLDHNTFDFNTYKDIGPGLRQILEPHSKDLDGFRTYAVSKRAQELHARGIETGVDPVAATQVVKDGGKYAKAFGQLQEYQNSLTKYMKDSGLLSDEGYTAMLEANKDYVPFFRAFEEEPKGGTGKGLRVHNPLRQIKGSERQILDPIESVIKNTYVYTSLAERNAAVRALGKLVAENPADAEALGISKVKRGMRPIEVGAKEVVRAFGAEGVELPQDTATIFRPNALRPDPNQVRYFDQGKPTVLNVPRELGDAVNATDRHAVGLLTKIIAAPAKSLRAGATLTPDFMARNIIRDQLSAYTFSDTGYVPLIDMVRGAYSLVKKDQPFRDWLKSGGANSALVSLDREYLQQHIGALDRDAGLMSRSWNVVKSPLEVLRISSELAENATRLGEFKRQKAITKSAILKGGFASREVTLDFQRIGSQTRALNMIAAFMNAGLEGFDRSVRAFKDNPVRTSVKIGTGIVAPSVLLWHANHSTPERAQRYNEIPHWERDLFWIVMTDEHTYRIPKPFEFGVIFGSGTERILDAWLAHDPRAAKDYMNSVGQLASVNVIPTAAVPILEQMTNHSFFTTNPLIPSRMEGILPEYQYHEYTSQTSRAVGRLIGAFPGLHDKSIASPIVIDNYIRAWTGGLGDYIKQALDLGLRKAGVLPDPPLPLKTLADMPVIKAFVVRYPSATAQSVADFYDEYTRREKAYQTFRYLVQQGDPTAALKELRIEPGAFMRLEGIHQSLGNLNNVIRLVYRNPEMSPSDKRQLIDTLYGQMIVLSREGVKQMDNINAVVNP